MPGSGHGNLINLLALYVNPPSDPDNPLGCGAAQAQFTPDHLVAGLPQEQPTGPSVPCVLLKELKVEANLAPPSPPHSFAMVYLPSPPSSQHPCVFILEMLGMKKLMSDKTHITASYWYLATRTGLRLRVKLEFNLYFKPILETYISEGIHSKEDFN
ncbi:hypothetical protein Celaphus_00010196, partial [Cervus elaphus hippelaphus]